MALTDEDPLISVVTPCLNPGQRLFSCIASVQRQSYRNIEHVVVDGGSVDGTIEALQRTDVQWTSRTDSGQSEAINRGVALTKGQIVTWLNADDMLTPTAISDCVRSLKATDAHWVYGDNIVIREGRQHLVRPPRKLRISTFADGNPIPQAGSLLTRDLWEQVGGLDESLHLVMDLALWLKVVLHGVKSSYVPRVLALVPIHARSKSGTTPSRLHLAEMHDVWTSLGNEKAAARIRGRLLAHAHSDRGVVTYSRVSSIGNQEPFSRSRVAGASLEAIRIEHDQGPKRLRHLMRASVWMEPRILVSLFFGLLRKATRMRFPRHV